MRLECVKGYMYFLHSHVRQVKCFIRCANTNNKHAKLTSHEFRRQMSVCPLVCLSHACFVTQGLLSLTAQRAACETRLKVHGRLCVRVN